jgi:mRNA interferase HicA
VKRREFVRELQRSGCIVKRSGGRHDIYHNPSTNRSAPVPRHAEIPNSLCNLIRRQLGIRDTDVSA